MIKIEIIESDARFYNIRDLWNELLENSHSRSIFLTWEWAFSWWSQYKESRELFILLLWDRKKLIGIAPLVIFKTTIGGIFSINRIDFLGSQFVSGEYLDFILECGREEEGLNLIFIFLKNNSNKWDELNLSSVIETSPNYGLIHRFAKKAKYKVEVKQRICPHTNLPKKWEDFIRIEVVKQLGSCRKTKRLSNKFDVKFYISDKDSLHDDLTTMFNLHQTRWQADGETGSFSSAPKRNFYKEISNYFIDKEMLRFYQLKVNDIAVASLFGFEYNQIYYYLQSGYDPDWNQYSVGTVLLEYVFKDAISRNLSRIDFLRGSEKYKYLWAAIDKKTFAIKIRSHNLTNMISYPVIFAQKIKSMFR